MREGLVIILSVLPIRKMRLRVLKWLTHGQANNV